VDKTLISFAPKFGFTYKINESNNLFAVANREPNRNDFLGSSQKPYWDLEFGWRLRIENIKLNSILLYGL
jgi:hypothetical protein